jgi:HEAT repeat protein
MKRLLVVVVLGVLLPCPALAQLYRWTDDQGTVHIADDLNGVPERYRSQVEQMSTGTPGLRSVPAAGGPEPRPRGLAPTERWRGRTRAEWERDAADPAPRVRAEAVSALAFFGASAVPVLTEALRDPDVQVRVGAARSLGQVGPSAGDAVTALARTLRDPDSRVRFDTAVALGRIGSGARDAVGALGRALNDPAPEVRVGAAMGLGGMGAAAQEMVPALAEALRAGNAVLRISAASALGNIGPGARSAVPALLAALRDSNTSVRTTAAAALGSIGPSAREAVPELRRLAEAEIEPGFGARAGDGPLRQKEGVLRQELRAAARQALRQIEGR